MIPLALKFGTFVLLGAPSTEYGDEKSQSFNNSNTCPPPLTWAFLLRNPKYLKSSLSPKAGTIIDRSQRVIEGLFPGIFNP